MLAELRHLRVFRLNIYLINQIRVFLDRIQFVLRGEQAMPPLEEFKIIFDILAKRDKKKIGYSIEKLIFEAEKIFGILY